MVKDCFYSGEWGFVRIGIPSYSGTDIKFASFLNQI